MIKFVASKISCFSQDTKMKTSFHTSHLINLNEQLFTNFFLDFKSAGFSFIEKDACNEDGRTMEVFMIQNL